MGCTSVFHCSLVCPRIFWGKWNVGIPVKKEETIFGGVELFKVLFIYINLHGKAQ